MRYAHPGIATARKAACPGTKALRRETTFIHLLKAVRGPIDSSLVPRLYVCSNSVTLSYHFILFYQHRKSVYLSLRLRVTTNTNSSCHYFSSPLSTDSTAILTSTKTLSKPFLSSQGTTTTSEALAQITLSQFTTLELKFSPGIHLSLFDFSRDDRLTLHLQPRCGWI